MTNNMMKVLKTIPYKSTSRYIGMINIHFDKNSWIVGSCGQRFVVQRFTRAFHFYAGEITSSLVVGKLLHIIFQESSFVDAIIESRCVIAPVACGYCVQSVIKALWNRVCVNVSVLHHDNFYLCSVLKHQSVQYLRRITAILTSTLTLTIHASLAGDVAGSEYQLLGSPGWGSVGVNFPGLG